MKLLLVDDDLLLCSALARTLIRIGHSSRTATSIESALTLVYSEAPDVILTDLELGPGGDGVDFIGRLRARGCIVPVIMMTGSDPDAARERLARAGWDVVAVLEKPFAFEELVARLVEIFPGTRPAIEREIPKTSMAAMMGKVMRTLSGRVT